MKDAGAGPPAQQRLQRVGAVAGRVEFLLNELRRRRVFRVVAGYLALTFALIQLADLVYPVLGFPEWAFPATVALTGILFIPTLILAWIYDITGEGLRRTPPVDAMVERADAAVVGSMAVLPFRNLTPGVESEYFSDGVTEDVIARVSNIAGLRVISRTSVMQYKGTSQDAGTIARNLGVTHILEGSVRQAAGRVRVVAQLIDARTDEHRWAETYDRDLQDIFTIQSDVANRVAEALEARLTSGAQARLVLRPTTNMDAYDLYLRGRFAWNRRTAEALHESVRLLRHATELDPGYAMAWAALADSHIVLSIHGVASPRESLVPARAAAARALELDPGLAEALNARACIAALSDFDFAAAERDFAAAIAANPQYATAYQWQAMHLHAPLARFDDARRALDVACEIDPLSPAVRASRGVLSYFQRRFDDTVAQCAEVLATWPSFGFAWYVTGLARLAQGDTGAAAEALGRALELSPGSAETAAALAATSAAAGDWTGAREQVLALEAESRRRWVSPVLLAQADAASGDGDRALARLEQAKEMHAPELVWIGVRPSFDGLRDHPGFVDLLARLGLPNNRA